MNNNNNNNNNKNFDLVYMLSKLKKKFNLLLINDNNVFFCNDLNNEICGFSKCNNVSYYLKNI